MKRFLEHSKQQNLPCWSIAIFTGIIAIIGAAGCSADADNAAKSDHDRRAIAGQVVRHSYVCDDRSRVDLDFLLDGLTIDLRVLPDGKPERLTTPAMGLTYVGDQANVAISNSDIAIMRPDKPTRVCRRAPLDPPKDQARPP